MDALAYKIIGTIIATFIGMVGGLFLYFVKKVVNDGSKIKLDLEIVKGDIKHALNLKEGVEADHDKLIVLESQLSNQRTQNEKEKKALFDKVREVNSKVERLEDRIINS